MTKYISFLVVILFHLSCLAQDDLCIGKNDSFHSNILNENRPYRVSLPISYYSSGRATEYPVVYVLDGEMAFDYYVSIVRFLSKGVYASIPEMIVIGIDNTNRTRDFTPTKSSVISPDDSSKFLFTNSGGGAKFISFLEKELKPHVDKLYRTSGYNVLAGHSFGGLLATEILLHHGHFFNAYLIHDPSIWWDNGYLINEEKKRLPQVDFGKTRVYLSQANNSEKGGFDAQGKNIKAFVAFADSVRNPTLNLKYAFYEKENHGSLPLPATYDGLKYIFEGYVIDFKKISSDQNLLLRHYKMFSEQMDFPFKPSKQSLEFMIKYFKSNNKLKEAEIVGEQYQYFYPQK